MYREVKINIPMFIGIIILVAAATAVLVYVVNFTRDFIAQSNEKMENDFQQMHEALDVENNLNEIYTENIVDDIVNTINDISNENAIIETNEEEIYDSQLNKI